MKYLRDALYTILIVLVQAMIGFWEIAIFSPGVLDTRPIYVFGIAFELLLAAFGVLFGAYVGSRSEHAGYRLRCGLCLGGGVDQERGGGSLAVGSCL